MEPVEVFPPIRIGASGGSLGRGGGVTMQCPSGGTNSPDRLVGMIASINIPEHFIRFFSYVEFYRKVFTGEISATKPSEPPSTPTVSEKDIITTIPYKAVPIDPFLIVQCIF